MPDSDPDATLPPSHEPDPDLTRPPGSPPHPPTWTANGTGDPGEPYERPTVPGFEIIRELGRGGMGVVYLARQIRLNRQVALKMVLAGGHAGPQQRLRFLQEAEAIAAVQHPGIVQVFEFGTCGDQPYFALEYCPGGSLAAKLVKTPLPPQQAAAMLEQVAHAIQAAHGQGIVHRDLKPDNVLFAADGTPKVTDFGLARKVESDSGLTKTGAIMGTPSYMAPEQAAGQKEVGTAADVWALGAILYECLTGRPPFRAATVIDTIMQVSTQEPVSPRQLQPGLPRDLDTITLRCLQKEPGKRYGSAAALAEDLRRFQSGEPIAARPIPIWERAWKAAKRRPAVALSLFLGAVAAVAMMVAFIAGVFAYTSIKVARDKLKTARDDAVTRQAEAETANRKAQAHLGKAIEAVDKVLNRVGSERWARDPALTTERRHFLEAIVTFYEGFDSDDARDPRVRRETAKAYRQIGLVYMYLAEYQKAKEVLARSRTILDGLVAEALNDGGYLGDLAETIHYIGHVSTSAGDSEGVGPLYREAANFARAAFVANPDDDVIRRTLIACLVSASYYGGDRTQTEKLSQEFLSHAEGLITGPDASFPNRVAAAYAYVGAWQAELITGLPIAHSPKMTRAIAILEQATPDSSTSAQHRDLFDITTGIILFYHANVALEKDRNPTLAVGYSRKAVALFDQLLTVYPKAFHFRMNKLRGLALETIALASLGRLDELRKCHAALSELEAAILKDSPKARFVKLPALMPRSIALVFLAKSGDVDQLDAWAADLLATASEFRSPQIFGNIRYNVACAYSMASKFGTTEEQEKRAARAVKELETLAAAKYFSMQPLYNHVKVDTDLKPLHNREDWKQFVAKLSAGMK